MRNSILAISAILCLAFMSCENDVTGALDGEATARKGRPVADHIVYVSSGTDGMLGLFNVNDGISDPAMWTASIPYSDADGIVFDQKRDAIYHVNRTDSRLEAYQNIGGIMNGDVLMPSASGPATFSSGREATVYNNKVVVADDVSPGKLVSYHVNTSHISEYRTHHTDLELWGIQMVGEDLWAIVDQSNMLAYFQYYSEAESGDLMPTSTVAIEGLVRTHGLNYDASADIMVLTDIGSAADANDGGLIVISDFAQKFAAAGDGGMIGLDGQVRIYGDLTELGNPVDVIVRAEAGAIFVAERAQGKFLAFDIPDANCNCAPVYSAGFPGASAVEVNF